MPETKDERRERELVTDAAVTQLANDAQRQKNGRDDFPVDGAHETRDSVGEKLLLAPDKTEHRRTSSGASTGQVDVSQFQTQQIGEIGLLAPSAHDVPEGDFI